MDDLLIFVVKVGSIKVVPKVDFRTPGYILGLALCYILLLASKCLRVLYFNPTSGSLYADGTYISGYQLILSSRQNVI